MTLLSVKVNTETKYTSFMLYCCITELSEADTTKQYATIHNLKYNHGWNMTIPMFVDALLKIFRSKMSMGSSIL